MKKVIKLDREWDTDEKISGLCSRLSRVPFKDWSYRGETSVHKGSKDKIEEGTFSLRQDQISYIVSKSYKESVHHITGACPVFRDGGYWVWDHYFSYFLRVSPQRQDAILIEGEYTDDTDDDPIVSLYDKLNNERRRLEKEKKEKIEERGIERESKRREKLQQAGKKILTSL